MKKTRDHKLNNAGISLVEIIIVLAIMGIIGGAVLLSTAIATDKQVTSCAEKLASSLEQTRSLVMGKQSGYVEISQVAGDYVYIQMYIDGQAFSDEVAIGKPGVIVNYTCVDPSDNSVSTGTLTAGSSIKVYFQRNGSVSKDHGPYVTEFSVTNGKRIVLVKIDQFTGRIETEKTA